jgi:hypothetical protein
LSLKGVGGGDADQIDGARIDQVKAVLRGKGNHLDFQLRRSQPRPNCFDDSLGEITRIPNRAFVLVKIHKGELSAPFRMTQVDHTGIFDFLERVDRIVGVSPQANSRQHQRRATTT